ncbi:lysine--tRNA ligase [Candidatus Woesearchaeota archaeon]|jgi:lysyl-tRNA synthetase, class II|nr:lysine--tRNA ligase [Candidatus Woesearchaeota archaeon]MBT4321945.1 lysine--tRNA ligase [Candidatus Woesearchaeota archaeon]MBT4631297.1 lysine--tRNA ligase [Candidatus Woesearchaeota archaeon]
MKKEENDLIKSRKEKLNRLIEEGINPYPYSFDKTHDSSEIQEEYSKLKDGEHTRKKVSVAGRVLTSRVMGKASFFTILDRAGKIQVFATKDKLHNYNQLKKVDHGDIIGIVGKVFKTKRGEVSIDANDFVLLTKSLRPLPDKHKGLKDEETRYRQRYLDFIANPEKKDIFFKRNIILKETRTFLDKLNFTEVEIPALQTIYGGAAARPFKTHINAWNIDLFLSISPELYLKRLLVGGFEQVYTIGKNFRNEGVDRTHNPEFTMMECYWAYKDYNDMMVLVENLVEHLAKKVTGGSSVKYQGKTINFKAPWTKLTMKGALKKYGKLNVDKLTDSELKKELKKHKLEIKKFTRGWAINELFEALVEEKLIQPTFITDYPKETSPLCKEKRGDPELIERFEFFINGHEVGNAYSELNNPLIQEKLLAEQEKERVDGDDEANPMDEDFVTAIEHGMPPAGGLGIGMDRIIMLLTDSSHLRDVIAFPITRPK